jgi:hypothetical protein
MGFVRIPCPACKGECRYPLTSGYLAFYWIFVVFNVLKVCEGLIVLVQGGIFIPNPIGICLMIYVMICLVKDTRLRRELNELEKTLPGENSTR